MHIEANIKIYFTRDYEMFKYIKGNRTLNEKKIGKIIKDIESGFNMLPYCPILVDEDLNVIDGQHRLQVAIRLQSNIWYVITNAATLHQIAKMNTNTERWKATDFINCYKEKGIEDYYTLYTFQKKYQFPLTLSLAFLSKGTPLQGGSNNIVELFESGEWRCKYIEEANELAKLVYRFKEYKGFLRGNFIAAIHAVSKANKCNIDDLVAKFQKNHTPLLQCSSRKSFMIALEHVYNLGNQSRRTIF